MWYSTFTTWCQNLLEHSRPLTVGTERGSETNSTSDISISSGEELDARGESILPGKVFSALISFKQLWCNYRYEWGVRCSRSTDSDSWVCCVGFWNGKLHVYSRSLQQRFFIGGKQHMQCIKVKTCIWKERYDLIYIVETASHWSSDLGQCSLE